MDVLEELQPVWRRHTNIQYHQVVGDRGQPIHHLRAVGRGVCVEPLQYELLSDNISDPRLIVYDEDTRGL